jgi:RNA polymerase sigma-70 factor (ECF subfamily)
METSVSLLERLRTQPDEAAWRRLHDLYRPLIRHWLMRDPSLREEADDLVQDVLAVLVRELPNFDRERLGSFRRWLHTVTVNRLKHFWRSRRHRPHPLGDSSAESLLAQLEDPASELSRQWDRDHDQHVMHRLLELIEPEFTPTTWQAFRRVVFEDEKAAQVAADLGLSVNAVLLAKSRVLSRLRQEGRGLLD